VYSKYIERLFKFAIYSPYRVVELMAEPEEIGIPGTKRDFAIFILVNLGIGCLLYSVLTNVAQTIAGTVFIATVIGTLMFWRFRVGIAFVGITILLLTGTIDLEHTITFMSLDVIIFLVGMMVIIGLLKEVGFFNWLMIKTIKMSQFDPTKLMLTFMVLSALTAALVGEVISILFVTAMILELCDRFDADPVPYIIMAVLATNIGSSATVLGNPIGLLIALRGSLTFEDYLRWATPTAIISLVSLMPLALFWYRKDMKLFQEKINAKLAKDSDTTLDEWAEVKDKRMFKQSSILFFIVLVFIALHYRIELLLGLEKNTILIATSIAGAGIVMLWQRAKARKYLEKDVDWWTLIFFMFLFAKAGCLKYTGLTDRLASSMLILTGGTLILALTLVLWVATWGSSVLDNVVLVAAFIPIVQSLGANGIPVFPLWWALLFGGCYGGNITMVGSTANIVALGVLEKRRHYYMKFFKWFWIGLVGGLVPTIVAELLLLVQLPLMH